MTFFFGGGGTLESTNAISSMTTSSNDHFGQYPFRPIVSSPVCTYKQHLTVGASPAEKTSFQRARTSFFTNLLDNLESRIPTETGGVLDALEILNSFNAAKRQVLDSGFVILNGYQKSIAKLSNSIVFINHRHV